ncbi:tRNA 2-selenouridine(34) synthase MnmH [Herminiimonas sp. CN]|uniref:tRNA 2-selenouridine(34) synthase MnmH n=1 Tax=Herminiimonas sp. CN TaxID=1349818 RepID=UPI00047407BD|nr:tRNA 2-selenouridine(34) synthase MnmH [Herminiimonas sp. CN]
MKYPALLPFAEVLPVLDKFDAIIDVRSPAEFAEDHIPGAINCPVLNNEERQRIGTLYKQVNAFEAKKAGALLVAKNIAHHIETLFLDKPREWAPLIYCWRGGNRSAALAHIMAKIGWPAVQLDGGYKEYRRYVNAALGGNIASQFSFQVLCGTTGSAKSRLLQVLAQQGTQVLDLEQLAAHRGSVLGNLPLQPQPSQKMFESRLWQALRQFDPAQVVFVESESKKVGNLRIPELLMEKIRCSPCIALWLSQENRIKLLIEDYAHFIADPDKLNAQLDCLVSLHGKEKIAQWHRYALSGDIEPLVAELLSEHYDPAYKRSIQRNFNQYNQARLLEVTGIDLNSLHSAARQLTGSPQ